MAALLGGLISNRPLAVLQHVRTYVQLPRPRQTKYKKFQKRLRNVSQPEPGEKIPPPPLHFHQHGIYARESFRMTASHIEASRRALVRTIGRKGSSVKIQVFPHIPITKKSVGVRMGKGKGNVDHFVAFVKAGKMLFEYSCPALGKQAYKAVSYKLPIKVGYVTNETSSSV